MKSRFLLPAVTAVLGFTVAWLMKPSASSTPAQVTQLNSPGKRSGTTQTTQTESSSASKRSATPKTGEYPLADLAEQGPKTREEAKMGRLTEALGLSFDQQGAIIKLIEDVQATASMNMPVLTDLTTRGKLVEEGLKSLLDPAQFAKFQEMRTRERDNRVELRAHQLLDRAIEEIDFSPEQREQALDRLRQQSKEEFQSIPDAATLFFEKSILPTGGKELPVEGVLALAKAGEPAGGSDPMVVHQRILDSQRAELERMLSNFDGILSPAQMGQYQAAIAEQRATIDKLTAQQRLDFEKLIPAEQPAVPPVPDDGEDAPP